MFKILYFTAKWCGPCKAMAPVVAEAQTFLNIEKVDAEENPSIVSQYNVRTVPTFVYLQNGQEVGRRSGMISKQEFAKLAETYK